MLFSKIVKYVRQLAFISLLFLPACGGSTSPVGPGPGPTAAPGHPVSGVVFYDVNANGILDPSETVRLPGVTVAVGGRTGETADAGRFTVANVPAGEQPAQVQAASLPAYFRAGATLTVSVPQATGAAEVPATLEIGRNHPNTYLGFGDSITSGVGGGGGGGYLGYLAADLRSHWGEATLENAGDPGTRTHQGEARLWQTLQRVRPAFTLILYGTNDWNDAECRSDFPCYTVNSLRSMIRQARDYGSNPVLGTIPPANPAYADRNAAARNVWVNDMNELVRTMAAEERVLIADIHADFTAQPSLESLFVDHVHPNDAGYQLMARTWFRAITGPATATTSGAALGFTSPGAP